MTRLLAVALSVTSLLGCSPALYQALSPTERLRTESIDTVFRLAHHTKDFIAANGEDKVIPAAMEATRQSLKDPESARFRNVSIVQVGASKVVCGEVNGKNSFGGYVGFTRFVASPYESMLYDTDMRYPNVWEASNAGIHMACGR